MHFFCCSRSSQEAPYSSADLVTTGPRRKYCWVFHFGTLSMILEPRRRVDVGLPYVSNIILHLAGNFTESTVVGLRLGSLANEGVLSLLLALRPFLSIPRLCFKQDFPQRGRLSLFRSN